MEVRFAIEYGDMHEKFWSHIDTGLSLVQVVAGALALAGAFAPGSGLASWAGLILAGVSGFQLTIKPRERSIQFRDTRRLLHDLNARAWSMSVLEVDAELERIRREAPRGLSVLTRPATNVALAANGFEAATEPLSRAEKFALIFV